MRKPGSPARFGGFTWDVFYNHGDSELKVTNPNNTDNAKYLASLDAVRRHGRRPSSAGSRPSRSSPACIRAACPPTSPIPTALRPTPTTIFAVRPLDADAENGQYRRLDRRRSLGLRPARRRDHRQPVGDARWATYEMDSTFCRPISSTARACACAWPTAARRCAGCRTPMRRSTPRTTSTKSRWNSTFRCSRMSRWLQGPLDQPGGPLHQVFDLRLRSNPGRPDSTGTSSIRSASAAPLAGHPGAEPQRSVPAGGVSSTGFTDLLTGGNNSRGWSREAIPT